MTEFRVTDVKRLGEIVRYARKTQKLTQEEAAGITGVGRRFIVDLENGKPTVQLGKTLQVLRGLGIAPSVSWSWGEG
jgi:HTH-type transcriptional regulator / antitoxin HipB